MAMKNSSAQAGHFSSMEMERANFFARAGNRTGGACCEKRSDITTASRVQQYLAFCEYVEQKD